MRKEIKQLGFVNAMASRNRPLQSYSKIQNLYSRIIRGRKFQLKKLKNDPKCYLNAGCGENINQNFINLDRHWHPEIQLCWDITKRLPIQTNSMKGVFSEHCLEHIFYSECCNVLKEFYRILRPGGVVRIVVPDAELYLDLYQKDKQGEPVKFPYVKDHDLQNGFTPMMAINRVFRDHGHRFAYDARTLEVMLKKAEFDEIRKESFMKGRDGRLLIDSVKRKSESLYIEAIARKA
jgi:predicted SAM-dependent methyltransferase